MRFADAAEATDDPLARAVQVEQVRIEMLRTPDFAVLGLTHPALTPSCLVDLVAPQGRIQQLALGYGEIDGSAGRYVRVLSGAAGASRPRLSDLLAAEAERLGAAVTQAPPSAPELTPADGLRLDRPMTATGHLTVDGDRVPVELLRQGRLWAGHLRVTPGGPVTVVARGVDPGSLGLGRVSDLRPYLAAWESRQLRALAAEVVETGGLARQAPADGLTAHLALLHAVVADRLSAGSAPAVAGGGHAALWDAAVAAQCHYAGLDRDQAETAVSSMVNQAALLADHCRWMADPARRESALSEIVRYTVFASDVRSRRAQEWWGRLWSLITSRQPVDRARARERRRGFQATQDVWLTGWDRWAGQ
jgi:hypothetical protein